MILLTQNSPFSFASNYGEGVLYHKCIIFKNLYLLSCKCVVSKKFMGNNRTILAKRNHGCVHDCVYIKSIYFCQAIGARSIRSIVLSLVFFFTVYIVTRLIISLTNIHDGSRKKKGCLVNYHEPLPRKIKAVK